ncbi:MAG TPA: protein kinase [Candidatus Binataceae bacterium]|nr:protein kinase [Candidatus Binataceae bacterium]
MAIEAAQLCMGCMDIRGDVARCPHCGFEEDGPQVSPLGIPIRTQVNDQYLIGRILGQGGFAITYIGWDTRLARRVAIKEYLPSGLATRAQGKTQVTVYSEEAGADFRYGLSKFLDEAQLVASFQNHPGIISVLNYFPANDTAYLVMEYLEGMTLKEYLKHKGGKLDFVETMAMMMPVMDALREVHAAGVLHRDISPDNIYITKHGQVKLLDFGAARHALKDRSQGLSVILKTGYAPEEQYRTSGNQGAWTDIYAIGATTYHLLTGKTPPPAIDRLVEDDLKKPSDLGVAIPPEQEEALLKALAVKAENRFQNLEEMIAAFAAGPAKPKEAPQEEELPHKDTSKLIRDTTKIEKEETQDLPPGRSRPTVAIAAGAGVVILVALVLLRGTLFHRGRHNIAENNGAQPTIAAQTSPQAAPTSAQQIAQGGPASPSPQAELSPAPMTAGWAPTAPASPAAIESPAAQASYAAIDPNAVPSTAAAPVPGTTIAAPQPSNAISSDFSSPSGATPVPSGGIALNPIPPSPQAANTVVASAGNPVAPMPAPVRHENAAPTSFQVEAVRGWPKVLRDAPLLAAPSASSEAIGEVVPGKHVIVTGMAPGYARVHLMKTDQIGYVAASALELVEPANRFYGLRTNAPVLNAPNKWADALAEVHRGHDVHVIGTAPGYVRIRMNDGLEGFVTSRALLGYFDSASR